MQSKCDAMMDGGGVNEEQTADRKEEKEKEEWNQDRIDMKVE